MKKIQTHKFKIVLGVIFLAGFFVLVYVANTIDTGNIYEMKANINTDTKKEEEKNSKKVSHIKTPKPLKAIYMTSCVAGTISFRNDLVKLIDDTELNSVIIDIKDYTGRLSFVPKNEELKKYVSNKCMAPDMESFIDFLHSKNIYVMGRVTVFQDPFYVSLHPESAVKRASDGGIWNDRKGISYIDPSSKEAWNHVLAIATSSYAIGFDEINFDYIRFPSDGNMKDINFPHSGDMKKSDVIENFFAYLKENLKDTGIVTSADLFGMVTVNHDDLNIGQVLEKGLPYFDYIAPMVYPSHFPETFNGWQDPNKYPYELIKYTMDKAVARTIATTTPIKTIGSVLFSTSTPVLYTKDSYDKDKIRPWLQDFDYGGIYDVKEVKAQIQATYDAGLSGWMLWAPSNRYTVGALEKEIDN